MRIEILVGSEDPIILPLKSSKFTIGSGDTCDFKLEASGISRKHLVISSEGDQFFVIDQGSTNGTFINEERLVPGKKTEFTSFFPVRLGDNVLVSLLSDEEDMDYSIPTPREKTSPNLNVKAERNDSTTVIKLNDLKKASTEKLVLERNQKRDIRKAKKTPPKPEKKKSIGLVPLICILLIAVAGYYNFFSKSDENSKETVNVVGKVVELEKVEQKPKEVSDAIPLDDLPKHQAYSNLLNDIKCATDLEKYLCNTIPGANQGQWGVGQTGLTFKAVVDGAYYLHEARQFIIPPKEVTPESTAAYERLVNKTAAYIFFMRKLPMLDEAVLGENKIAVGFFDVKGSEPILKFAVGFYPKIFNREKANFKESHLFLIKNNGEVALKDFESHFTIY